MSFLHLGHCYETRVFTPDGSTVRTSKNLQGMRDYARVSPVVKVETRKDDKNIYRGLLRVTYENGNYSTASFASYSIMIDWVRNRRSWRTAVHLMNDENMGYLTKPGIIAGE